nr:hypothetical protein Iba_chr15bCG5850 [Ipomoea batatas]
MLIFQPKLPTLLAINPFTIRIKVDGGGRVNPLVKPAVQPGSERLVVTRPGKRTDSLGDLPAVVGEESVIGGGGGGGGGGIDLQVSPVGGALGGVAGAPDGVVEGEIGEGARLKAEAIAEVPERGLSVLHFCLQL